MNVLYIGVDNPVEIAVSVIPENAITVTISNGMVTKTVEWTWTYNVRVKQVGRICINIFYKGKQIGKKEFRVKYIPEPIEELDSQGTKFGHRPHRMTLLGVSGIRVIN